MASDTRGRAPTWRAAGGAGQQWPGDPAQGPRGSCELPSTVALRPEQGRARQDLSSEEHPTFDASAVNRMMDLATRALILAGADDGCIGADLFRDRALARNPACRVDILDGAGHFLHLEQPERVAALVVAHLTPDRTRP